MFVGIFASNKIFEWLWLCLKDPSSILNYQSLMSGVDIVLNIFCIYRLRVVTPFVYSPLFNVNIRVNFIGSSLFLIAAIVVAIGLWAYRGHLRGILILQFFYALASIICMLRWF